MQLSVSPDSSWPGRRLAQERETTRRGVIAKRLKKEEEARIQAVMVEGSN